jgi:trehalose synthase
VTRVVTAAPEGLLEQLREVAGEGPLHELQSIARELAGHRIAMVNSTAVGGGVAEILHRLVPLLQALGVPTTWEVMPGDEAFYAVSKKLHNALHGLGEAPTPAEHDHYRSVNRRAASALELDADLIMIHDPQPAAIVETRRERGQHWVWRCHIDLERANPGALDLVTSRAGHYDAAVYSHAAFMPRVAPGYLVPPSIDPLSAKNAELDARDMDELLAPFGLPDSVPWVTQVSRFDRLKDPIGVLRAFRLARRQERAHLVLAGGTADDDPEGTTVLAEVREAAKDFDDVSVLTLPPDAHLAINALQRRSTVLVQKSLREGFALTVAEGLWKRRAVVASAVGGIPLQVLHERTGLLVRSPEGCAAQIVRLLRDAGLRRTLGSAGREHVRRNFLQTREARDYLAIFLALVRGLRQQVVASAAS